MDFYSHAPRGARLNFSLVYGRKGGISTHTPLAGRDQGKIAYDEMIEISTHTPLAGRDWQQAVDMDIGVIFLLTRPSRGATCIVVVLVHFGDISTHTPLAGRDCGKKGFFLLLNNFYSHAPRGARLNLSYFVFFNIIISTHTPLAGRDKLYYPITVDLYISTHTPLAGRDL